MNPLAFLNSMAGQQVGSVAAFFAAGSYLVITFMQKMSDGWPNAGTYIEGWELVSVVVAFGIIGASIRAFLGLERRTITVPTIEVPEQAQEPQPQPPAKPPVPISPQPAPKPPAPPPAAVEPPETPEPEDVDEAPDRTPPAVNPTSISAAGLGLIKEFEGFRAEPYTCSGGKLTIGYGHVILPEDDITPPITEAKGAALLHKDVGWAERAVDRYCTVDLVQHQFDALVSFTFNVGSGAFQGSTLLRRLNAGEYDAVRSELMRWVHAGGQRVQGLVNRREREADVFDHGLYT